MRNAPDASTEVQTAMAPNIKPVAFLVLAHHQPDLLSRLLGRLASPWSSAFVHLDERSEAAQFSAARAMPNTTFLSNAERVQVHWCGYSMVTATLNLLRKALHAPLQPQRFVLLSGADYPAQALSNIGKILSQDREFIQIDRAIDLAGDNYFDKCLNRRFLGDNPHLNDRSSIPILPYFARKLERLLRRGSPDGLEAYYGPSWWSLTREAVLEILDGVNKDPTLMTWFSGARSPDESVFQTLIARTSRLEKVAFNALAHASDPIRANRHALHYVDFSVTNPPKLLTLEDLPAIRASGALFARKVSLERSSPLLDALDQEAEAGG